MFARTDFCQGADNGDDSSGDILAARNLLAREGSNTLTIQEMWVLPGITDARLNFRYAPLQQKALN
jgi:hypothetical protein